MRVSGAVGEPPDDPCTCGGPESPHVRAEHDSLGCKACTLNFIDGNREEVCRTFTLAERVDPCAICRQPRRLHNRGGVDTFPHEWVAPPTPEPSRHAFVGCPQGICETCHAPLSKGGYCHLPKSDPVHASEEPGGERCRTCGKPATCRSRGSLTYACDDCCYHGPALDPVCTAKLPPPERPAEEPCPAQASHGLSCRKPRWRVGR